MIPTTAQALALTAQYNKEPFHLRHAITVGAVMRRMANDLGHTDALDFWQVVGILHDIDFELYPEQHCTKSQELLRAADIDERIIRATASHGYGIAVDIKPEHEMEKVLYAVDELTGLIGAAAKMRPSGSTKDMELKSLKKKYKSPAFAAGCSRDVIANGADMLGWPIDDLLERTLSAMREDEDDVNAQMEKLG